MYNGCRLPLDRCLISVCERQQCPRKQAKRTSPKRNDVLVFPGTFPLAFRKDHARMFHFLCCDRTRNHTTTSSTTWAPGWRQTRRIGDTLFGWKQRRRSGNHLVLNSRCEAVEMELCLVFHKDMQFCGCYQVDIHCDILVGCPPRFASATSYTTQQHYR